MDLPMVLAMAEQSFGLGVDVAEIVLDFVCDGINVTFVIISVFQVSSRLVIVIVEYTQPLQTISQMLK